MMTTPGILRASVCAAALLALALGLAGPSRASDPAASSLIRVTASDSGSRFVPLGIGKSIVIDLPGDIKDVLVADPKIANAVVRTSRRAYIIGAAVGQTNVFFFDANGTQLAGFDIAVKRDLNGVRAALKQMFPNSDVRIEGVGDGVILSGSVSSQVESQQAYDLAVRLVGGEATKVANAISVNTRDQVMLKVTVAEIQRDIVKQLGIDLNGALSNGAENLAFSVVNPFTAAATDIGQSTVSGGNSSVQGTLRAMERAGVIRTLAEPTLTAISGESASFLAGGEFPVPGGYTCGNAGTTLIVSTSCQISIQFKKFGVGLNFTPVVLSEGRISLKVMTEVSELSNENAITLQPVPGGSSLTIPSIRTRRADTTVEIPSGGSLAMAGMLQEQTRQAINGFPGLMQLPVLGALFRSRDYLNRQTELAVIITPYVVRAVARKDLSRPDDGYADSSDGAAVLLGRINRIYGRPNRNEPAATASYRGKYGFIVD